MCVDPGVRHLSPKRRGWPSRPQPAPARRCWGARAHWRWSRGDLGHRVAGCYTATS